MAVHVPLSIESQAEARLLMLASNNILSPATGTPIVTPSQDMVLGCYYLTAENPKAIKGADRYFSHLEDVITAFEQGIVDLHAYVWVRFDGEMVTGESEVVDAEEKSTSGIVTRIYKTEKTGKVTRRIRVDEDGIVLSQYIRTTPGRVIFNKTVQDVIID